MVWLVAPLPLLDTKGLLGSIGWKGQTKILCIDPSCLQLICSEFSDVLEKPGISPEKAIKHEIDLLLYSVLPAKSQYSMSPVELIEVKEHFDEYLSKLQIRPNTSPYRARIIFIRKKEWCPKDMYKLQGSEPAYKT